MNVWRVDERYPLPLMPEDNCDTRGNCCDNCDGAPDGGHTHADSCCQREAAEPIYFSCGHCAVEHVLADPAGRETPESVDAPAGTVVRSCPRDGGNPSRH